MTYLARPRRPRVRRRPALSGITDIINDILHPFDEPARNLFCPQVADATAAELDAKIGNIESTWNPTGFYTQADINKIVDTTLSEVGGATQTLQELAADMEIADRVRSEFGALMSRSQESLVFINASREAAAKGIRVINAPGVKGWVISTLRAARDLTKAMALASCDQTAIARGAVRVARAADVIGSVVRAIGGTALAVGEKAIDAVGGIGKLLAFVAKNAPWIALIGGGAFLAVKVKQIRDRRPP